MTNISVKSLKIGLKRLNAKTNKQISTNWFSKFSAFHISAKQWKQVLCLHTRNFLYRWKGNVFDKYCATPCTAAEKLLVWWTSGPFQERAEVNFSVWYDLLNILEIKYSFIIYNLLIQNVVLGIFLVLDWPIERVDARSRFQINTAEWFNGAFLCIEWTHDFKSKIRPWTYG